MDPARRPLPMNMMLFVANGGVAPSPEEFARIIAAEAEQAEREYEAERAELAPEMAQRMAMNFAALRGGAVDVAGVDVAAAVDPQTRSLQNMREEATRIRDNVEGVYQRAQQTLAATTEGHAQMQRDLDSLKHQLENRPQPPVWHHAVEFVARGCTWASYPHYRDRLGVDKTRYNPYSR